MAKRAEAEGRVIKSTIIKPVQVFEADITRDLYADGSVVYRGYNDPIDVIDDTLYDVVSRPLEKMEALASLLDDDYWSRVGFIMESIINETRKQYEELFDHIERELGTIRVDVVRQGQCRYRPERIAGVRVLPKEAEQGVPE